MANKIPLKIFLETLENHLSALSAEELRAILQDLDRVYAEHLADNPFSPAQQKAALAWCMSVATQRVEGIVGGLHRKSYDKAASLTMACAEMLSARGEAERGKSYIAEIRQQFPRHSAFQREFRGV